MPVRVRGPCVSPGICSLRQDPGRTVMFGRSSPANSPQSEGEIRDGQGMNQNPNHAPDAVVTCGESVALIQIGSERVDRRQNEARIGPWTACLQVRQKLELIRKFRLIEGAAKVHW